MSFVTDTLPAVLNLRIVRAPKTPSRAGTATPEDPPLPASGQRRQRRFGRFLAKISPCRSRIQLLSGQTSRTKRVLLAGMKADEIRGRME